MINVKDHNTEWLFDPWSHIGPQRFKLLDKSWVQIFRKYLFEKLPIAKVAEHFDAVMGRKTKELYAVIGALILQQIHDLSDFEVTMAVAFNIEWQYALDITDNSDKNTYFCDRTIRRYRKILIDDGLDKMLFEKLTDTMIEKFGVNTSKQRLDSTYIRSNMRILSQIGIFSNTIQKFLKKLQHSNSKLYGLVMNFGIRYLDKDSENLFSQVKPSCSSKTINDMAKDILYLVEFFRPYKAVRNLPEYGLLERILNESCSVTVTGIDKTVELKPFKEISPDSLQNPSDPEAGYDAHKGKGYQAQIMETYQTDKGDDRSVPDLITYVEVEPAHIHDSHALIPAIDASSERNCCPDELICDSLYGSDDNVQAVKQSVEVISPIMGNSIIHEITLDKFEIDTVSNFIIRCPEGSVPENVCRTRKNTLIAKFNKNACSTCPHLKDCPVRIGKKASYLRYDDKMLRQALRRAFENTKEFKDKYRWRAGVEATMSHLKNDLGLKRLRVRGFASVRFVVMLKVLGLNILRCAKALGFPLFNPYSKLCTSFISFLESVFTFCTIFCCQRSFFINNRQLLIYNFSYFCPSHQL